MRARKCERFTLEMRLEDALIDAHNILFWYD